MNNRFIILIGSYNNEQWVESNINSILSQDYDNYKVLYYDDCSSDKTFCIAKNLINNNSKFTLIKNNIRKFKTWFYFNIHEYIKLEENDILVFLDGDDMFYCENVLSYINEIYNQKKCWMTYGGMIVWNRGVGSGNVENTSCAHLMGDVCASNSC